MLINTGRKRKGDRRGNLKNLRGDVEFGSTPPTTMRGNRIQCKRKKGKMDPWGGGLRRGRF